MASGVAVNEKCWEAFHELKIRHKYKFIIFKLSDDNTEIVVETAAETGDYAAFLSQLPESVPRYAVYDFEYEKPGEGLRTKIVFYAWTPDTSKIRAKMMYAASKEALRRSLVGIAIEVQGSDLSEVDEDAVLEKAQRSN